MTNLFITIAILFAFCLSGCATTNARVSSGAESDIDLEEESAYTLSTLPVTGKLRFHDLPVPVGFKLLKEKSFVFQSEGTRVALLKYTGRAKLQNLIDFYQEQMLFYNWELLNVVEYDKSVLNFERSDQTCIVTIEPRGMSKFITISVAPKTKARLKSGIEAQTQSQKVK